VTAEPVIKSTSTIMGARSRPSAPSRFRAGRQPTHPSMAHQNGSAKAFFHCFAPSCVTVTNGLREEPSSPPSCIPRSRRRFGASPSPCLGERSRAGPGLIPCDPSEMWTGPWCDFVWAALARRCLGSRCLSKAPWLRGGSRPWCPARPCAGRLRAELGVAVARIPAAAWAKALVLLLSQTPQQLAGLPPLPRLSRRSSPAADFGSRRGDLAAAGAWLFPLPGVRAVPKHALPGARRHYRPWPRGAAVQDGAV